MKFKADVVRTKRLMGSVTVEAEDEASARTAVLEMFEGDNEIPEEYWDSEVEKEDPTEITAITEKKDG